MGVNEIGVDPQNNVYFAGDGGDTCWMSKLDSSAGKYATPVAIAGQVADLGDLNHSEALAIAP